MKKLKLAVIGAGHLGRIHARLAAQLEDVELVGIADPAAQARHDVAAEVGARPYADYRDLADQIDAAIVATPTVTHHAVGLDLLERGVHLLIEKPLASTSAQAEELVEAAKRQGVVLQVGHVERFNPALVRVAPYLQDPKYIEAVRISGYPFRSTDIGVVLDLMIHDIDVALALVRSPVVQVEALGVSILGQQEDTANARITFENGCVASFTASRVSYRSQRSMQVWTPRAFAAIDFGMRSTTLVHPSQELAQRHFDLEALSPERKSQLRQDLFKDLFSVQAVEGAEGNALADEQRDLVESVRTGRAPQVTGEQGRENLQVAEQVLEKIAAHCWDGFAGGRVGPLAAPSTPILRAKHWDLLPQEAPRRREAG